MAFNERFRPQYHITPAENWLNDPNGLVYYKGRYHVFYQYNPNTKFPGDDKWWAHVSSTDLVNWEEEPVALCPDEFGSMWSGSAVVDHGNTSGLFDRDGSGLVAFYTCTSDKDQQQCMAYSLDDGKTWIKYNGGKPIITVDDDPLRHHDFRDPKVFWHSESGRWMMIVGGGPLRFFSSDNLREWRCEGAIPELHTECPDLYRMKVAETGEYKWVLSRAAVWYMVGDFRKVDGLWRFVPESGNRKYNFGQDIYAGQTFSDTGDRRILIEWMVDAGYTWDIGRVTDPWNGALSLPYELTLHKEGDNYVLHCNPVKELETLRKDALHFCAKDANSNIAPSVNLDIYELDAKIDLKDSKGVSVSLVAGDGKKTVFSYSTETKTFTLDRSDSGIIPTPRFANVNTAEAETEINTLDLRIFVDRSSVEIFANDGRYVFTSLVFPENGFCGNEIRSLGGDIDVEELTVYPLRSIYGNN